MLELICCPITSLPSSSYFHHQQQPFTIDWNSSILKHQYHITVLSLQDHRYHLLIVVCDARSLELWYDMCPQSRICHISATIIPVVDCCVFYERRESILCLLRHHQLFNRLWGHDFFSLKSIHVSPPRSYDYHQARCVFDDGNYPARFESILQYNKCIIHVSSAAVRGGILLPFQQLTYSFCIVSSASVPRPTNFQSSAFPHSSEVSTIKECHLGWIWWEVATVANGSC